jgi:hypothetical protein
VCQWVMQARVANSQAALTRLAAMAQSMACVFALPEWPAMAGEAAAAVGADVLTPAAADSSQGPGQLQQQQQQGQQGQGAAAAALDASTESLGLTGMDISRDFESGFKGVPPPEPSSEPSALARLWAGTGAAVGQAAAWGEPGPAGREAAAAAGAAAAAAALAAAEGVCWPQAFLTGCAVLIQVSCCCCWAVWALLSAPGAGVKLQEVCRAGQGVKVVAVPAACSRESLADGSLLLAAWLLLSPMCAANGTGAVGSLPRAAAGAAAAVPPTQQGRGQGLSRPPQQQQGCAGSRGWVSAAGRWTGTGCHALSCAVPLV